MGFEDLPDGHINRLNPAYFQTVDRLLAILVEHEIVPVLQPVFMGFGWKGLSVAGPVVPPPEYARYCRYLVARYGARPAVYLVGGDGSGYEPQVPAGGDEVERWDAYRQPAGIHYRPHADNRAWQDAAWLDFQWCQTGHSGEHVPERVADMWRNTPLKAVANGEPTYENGGGGATRRGLVAGPRGLVQPLRGRHDGRGLWRGQHVAVAAARGRARPPAFFPGRGRGLARGAGLRGLALRGPARAHPGRAAHHGHGAQLGGDPGPARAARAGHSSTSATRRRAGR